MRLCLRGGRNLGRHVVRIRQPLVVQVAAFLRQQLIFDVHRPGAGILERAHHVHHVQRLAIPRVPIGKNGKSRTRVRSAG